MGACSAQNMPCNSSAFPYEVLPDILKKLEPNDLAAAECVSRAFRREASRPALWANAPLIFFSLTSERRDAYLSDESFEQFLKRAGGLPRRNIDVLDFEEQWDLTPRSLASLLKVIDKGAKPPKYIHFSDCRLDSKELVLFLAKLKAKLDAHWDLSKTRLILTRIGGIFDVDVPFLQEFHTKQLSEDACYFDFWCNRCHAHIELGYGQYCTTCGVSVCDTRSCRLNSCKACRSLLCLWCQCTDPGCDGIAHCATCGEDLEEGNNNENLCSGCDIGLCDRCSRRACTECEGAMCPDCQCVLCQPLEELLGISESESEESEETEDSEETDDTDESEDSEDSESSGDSESETESESDDA